MGEILASPVPLNDDYPRSQRAFRFRASVIVIRSEVEAVVHAGPQPIVSTIPIGDRFTRSEVHQNIKTHIAKWHVHRSCHVVAVEMNPRDPRITEAVYEERESLFSEPKQCNNRLRRPQLAVWCVSVFRKQDCRICRAVLEVICPEVFYVEKSVDISVIVRSAGEFWLRGGGVNRGKKANARNRKNCAGHPARQGRTATAWQSHHNYSNSTSPFRRCRKLFFAVPHDNTSLLG